MSDQIQPDLCVVSDRVDVATRRHLFAAADLAPRRYPGAVGELLRQELLSWMVFGLHLGNDLIMRVADDVVAEVHHDPPPQPGGDPAGRNRAAGSS